MASLDVDGKADFRTAAGPGAGAFLCYPVDPECELEGPLWATAARRRPGLDHPEAAASELSRLATTCTNKDEAGRTCGALLDRKGRHAAACPCGGGRLTKHGRTARAVAGLARRWYDVDPGLEQRVPELDRQRADGSVEHARLDVAVPLLSGRQLTDVTIRQGAAGNAAARLQASRKDGVPSRRAERKKARTLPN